MPNAMPTAHCGELCQQKRRDHGEHIFCYLLQKIDQVKQRAREAAKNYPQRGKTQMNRSQAKGSAFERQIADYLQTALEDDHIDRRVKNGAKDRGDISGVRIHNQRLVIECKNTARTELPAWTNEAHLEAGNDDALVGLVIHKRRGHTDPGKQFVAMTVDDLCALITGERHGHRKDYA
jgi:hypothetical protein